MARKKFEGVWKIIANSMGNGREPEGHWAHIKLLDNGEYELKPGNSNTEPDPGGEQILVYDDSNHQLVNKTEDRGRRIAYWERDDGENGSKNRIFAMRLAVGSSDSDLPWEKFVYGPKDDKTGTWGAEEDPPP